mmetsp:Transcript_26739/g.88870  ORF Transcript_26739/g.88870 Transcript_26739/m.88870 type:complete len:507 (+) Transcript_26739:53-1573(+)|eukprot:CAMPEP_0203862208 /NCGR_PEP_ID=MMETSP0359-20131031/13458_1 /ASSEMBLY_ACC=CAM_ASM_000338 /TAXON_ID=268821 /ORGANISM="Scrippsiella Hangoei, Strain SHTV-5" /LENGTH=506 /DNA_ID=CAMNT_0050779567 /DNA_START=41 /DNA_END=1561 /DNA_ORIENTATION=-
MGARLSLGLLRAVESVLIKRYGGPDTPFRVGLAEMNGWRPSMEDSHVVLMRADWGFFGVFDGHGGSQCSSFVAKRLVEELDAKHAVDAPVDNDAVFALARRLDKEFLDSGMDSGSTGTFAIVHSPPEAGGRYRLRVGNIGDSRVLLGRKDGSMVRGQGSDGALTKDHKPSDVEERARIVRGGGFVERDRVNGELAVSRSFGDHRYKATDRVEPQHWWVTADPDFVDIDCDAADFLILVCDGISEGDFPNWEVVQFAADMMGLRQEGSKPDPGAAAEAVCRRALAAGSKDNLSCMIVLLGGGEVPGQQLQFVPGPIEALSDPNVRQAYEEFAAHANLTLAEAVSERYDLLQKRLDLEESAQLRRELGIFGAGPPASAEAEARLAWFGAWLQHFAQGFGGGNNGGADAGGGGAVDPPRGAAASASAPASSAASAGQGTVGVGPVRVVSGECLRRGVEAHSSMEWQDGLLELANRAGMVIDLDEAAGTAMVKFSTGREWLPTSVLVQSL